jgi:hypothetical protein
MAVFSAVFGFSGDAAQKVTALATVTASAEVVLGSNALFAIVGRGSGANVLGGAFNLVFGNAGMGAPTAANFQFPGATVFTLQTGDHSDRIRVFNPDATAIDVYIQRLDRF